MNTLLIKSVNVAFPGHPFHNRKADILIAKGKIARIASEITTEVDGVKVIDAGDQFIAPGFFDLNANFGEPGLETKEDIITGSAAALAGGFTGVAVHPNTQPPVDSHAEVALIVNRAKTLPVDVYPIGTISKKRAGEELAELYDMKLAGAIAFGDGNKPVQQAGLMSRALLYSKGFDGLIFSYADDTSVSGGAKMNEGITSTYLGMKGNPNLAETLMIARDLYLAEYHDAAIHFTTVSTAQGVDLIRRAKERGIRVSCDVAAHHLVLTDDLVAGFDSNYKVNPPLRTEQDVTALLKGLADGTIDAIVSQHTPHEVEFKNVEYEIAAYGIIGLQTVLPLALRAGLTPHQLVEKLAVNPRKILGLGIPALDEGAEANFVLFNPREKWMFTSQRNRSKSANSPLLGTELTGKVTLVANNRQLITI
ncbi:dihydroorotase [Parapedobacter lycopersici]|uniref:dihydroorotase n=1 Tax=Parapedobacter lycopersici TaxID=1864939 RepID=UPI00214D4312|nr:dihydroorotase [Parapedobacter lycopersici]